MARVPGYRLHKPSGLAFIEIKGNRHYIGKHGTPESQAKYRAILTQNLAGLSVLASTANDEPLTVDDLIVEFMEFARGRYVKNNKETSEVRSFQTALGAVSDLYGDIPAEQFGPKKLKVVRKSLIKSGICRKRVNGHVGRIQNCWKWDVAEELVAESPWRSLTAVSGLRVGEAADLPPVEPVELARVEAIRPKLSPTPWGLIQFQLASGCRPGEACSVRMCDLKTSGDVWEFWPESHKTEYHGKQRVAILARRDMPCLTADTQPAHDD